VLAAPFVVLTGLPVLGYVAGALAWIVNRALGEWVQCARPPPRTTSARRSASTSAR
jgi:hypothetical protein